MLSELWRGRRLGCLVLSALLLAACGGSDNGSNTDDDPLPFEGTRVYRVTANRADRAPLLVRVRDDQRIEVWLTSGDGRFVDAPVTITSTGEGRLTGTARSGDDECAVLLAFGAEATQVTVTLTCSDGTFTGSGGVFNGSTADGLPLPEALDTDVAAVQDLLEAAVVAPGSVADLRDYQPSWLSGLQDNNGCPTIGVTPGGSVLAPRLTAVFDYGSGCGTTVSGSHTLAGRTRLVFNPLNGQGQLTFDGLSVDGQAVTGGAGVTVDLDQVPQQLGMTLDLDLAVDGLGATEGTLDLELSNGSRFRLPSGTLALTDAEAAIYAVTITDLIIDPAAHGGFVPSSGTLAVAYPVAGLFGPTTVPITLTFDEQSPTTGAVRVQVAGLPARTVTIPGLTG